MSRAKGLVARLRAVLRRGAAEERMEEEFRIHLQMEAEQNIRKGVDPAVAQRRAAVAFGGVERYREEMRDGRGARALEEFWLDIRYAARALRLNPMFSFVVLVTLAVGIGANTAVFTLVDALLLRSLPVPHPEQLVVVGDATRVSSISAGGPLTDLFSYPMFQEIRKQNTVLQDVFATGPATRLDVRIAGDATRPGSTELEHPVSRYVSGNYFSILQVVPPWAAHSVRVKTARQARARRS